MHDYGQREILTDKEGEFQGIATSRKAQNKSRFIPKFPQDMLAEIRE